MIINMLIVEDNERLLDALKTGLEATSNVCVEAVFTNGEAVLEYCQSHEPPDVILMDVALAGEMNGIQAAAKIRRVIPRQPVVFYSIQDDDAYYRAFLRAGILTHYAYVRKSNYLLPEMIIPLLRDATAGRSFVDEEIAERVQEVRHRDANSPFDLLEPNEQEVARLLAGGLTNEQIAARMGLRDKRTISRFNGQIYAAWGLAQNSTDEKIARTRAVLIVQAGRMIYWDTDGKPFVRDQDDELIEWNG